MTLEFHDSQVSLVEAIADTLLVHFSAAHVRRNDAVGMTEGYLQDVEMVFSAAVWSGPLHECIGKLADAQLFIGRAPLRYVPIPHEQAGEVSITLAFANATTLVIAAKSLRVHLRGEPRFVESFAC